LSKVGNCVGSKWQPVKCLRAMCKQAAEEDPDIVYRLRKDTIRWTMLALLRFHLHSNFLLYGCFPPPPQPPLPPPPLLSALPPSSLLIHWGAGLYSSLLELVDACSAEIHLVTIIFTNNYLPGMEQRLATAWLLSAQTACSPLLLIFLAL
jgi:hypothetical protein